MVYKLGGIPEASAVVFFFVSLAALIASAFLLKDMVGLDFKAFMSDVMFKVFMIALVAFISPSLIFLSYSEGWGRLFLLSAVATFVTAFVVYTLGMERGERQFVFEKLRHVLLRK